MVLVVRNPAANAGDVRDTGPIPGSGRSPGGGNDNPLQYACLENPMGIGNRQLTVHGITIVRHNLALYFFLFFLNLEKFFHIIYIIKNKFLCVGR